MILSNRMTAKSLDAKPAIQASNNMVKVIKELRPAALVKVEVLICLVVVFLSGNIIFFVFVADDLFGNILFSK